MLSPEVFALGHLAIIAGGLIAIVVMDRRSRNIYSRWHRHVRYRQLTTEEVLKRLRKAAR